LELYHSQSREFIDFLMGIIGKRPFRCKICNRRFHAREPQGTSEPAEPVPPAQKPKPQAQAATAQSQTQPQSQSPPQPQSVDEK
jgi:hypothetical protein